MSNEVYKLKQEWLERVMASKLTHAEKTFAFCIYTRAYGDKVTSFPDTAQIKEDGGFTSHGHFTQYRETLVQCGAITAELDYHTNKATNKNYTYTINLNWNGVAPGRKTRAVAPLGQAMSPTGQSHGTSGTSRGTSGDSNTTNNTTSKTSKEDNNNAPVVADAPTVTSDDSLTQEVKEDQYVYMGTLKDDDFKPFPNIKGNLAFAYLANSEGVTSGLVHSNEVEVQVPLSPEVTWRVDEEEYDKGERYLEVLLKKNNIVGEARSKARRRYHDEDYMPNTHGMMRAGWVVGHLSEKEEVSVR